MEIGQVMKLVFSDIYLKRSIFLEAILILAGSHNQVIHNIAMPL